MKTNKSATAPVVTDQEIRDALRACREALVDLSLCLKERQLESELQGLQAAEQTSGAPSFSRAKTEWPR